MTGQPVLVDGEYFATARDGRGVDFVIMEVALRILARLEVVQ